MLSLDVSGHIPGSKTARATSVSFPLQEHFDFCFQCSPFPESSSLPSGALRVLACHHDVGTCCPMRHLNFKAMDLWLAVKLYTVKSGPDIIVLSVSLLSNAFQWFVPCFLFFVLFLSFFLASRAFMLYCFHFVPSFFASYHSAHCFFEGLEGSVSKIEFRTPLAPPSKGDHC